VALSSSTEPDARGWEPLRAACFVVSALLPLEGVMRKKLPEFAPFPWVARLDHPEEYMRRVLTFFDRYLRGEERPGPRRATNTA